MLRQTFGFDTVKMNNLLVNKISIVVGIESPIANDIVKAFLNEGATVIAPAESSRVITELRNGVCGISTSKLITFVTDGHDHLKILEVANFTRNSMEMYTKSH